MIQLTDSDHAALLSRLTALEADNARLRAALRRLYDAPQLPGGGDMFTWEEMQENKAAYDEAAGALRATGAWPSEAGGPVREGC